MNTNIDKLQELTESLPPFISLTTGVPRPLNFKHLKTATGGPLLIAGLYKTADVAVSISYMAPDTVLGTHYHDETEILVVYSGEMIITYALDDIKHTINSESGPFTILPNVGHKAECHVPNTWMVAMTIPAAEGYPDDR